MRDRGNPGEPVRHGGVPDGLASQIEKDSPGVSQGVLYENRIIDKNGLIVLLQQKSYLLESQARGFRRLADLVTAGADYDHDLFSLVVDKLAKD